jgi:hypothetical protein
MDGGGRYDNFYVLYLFYQAIYNFIVKHKFHKIFYTIIFNKYFIPILQ